MKTVGKNYALLEKLGEGTYGMVYKALDKNTGSHVAIKKYKDDGCDGVQPSIIREISILKSLSGAENVVQLQTIFTEGRDVFVVMEYLENNLKNYCRKNKLKHCDIKRIMYQILNGMNHCHEKGIMHRDMKTENILVASDGYIKLADFGLARECLHGPEFCYSPEVMTLPYRAPEILLGCKTYNSEADMWSVGCIFVELLTGKRVFGGDCEIDTIYRIFQVMGTPQESDWPGVSQLKYYKTTFPKWKAIPLKDKLQIQGLCENGLDLMERLLSCDPSKRISAFDALNHPYFFELYGIK
jgi:serine/threonine protein kinase